VDIYDVGLSTSFHHLLRLEGGRLINIDLRKIDYGWLSNSANSW
jgi:hypothetical protein